MAEIDPPVLVFVMIGSKLSDLTSVCIPMLSNAMPNWDEMISTSKGPISASLLPNNHSIKNGRLQIGGCDVEELARTYGSPLYVYDEEHIRARCREAVKHFGTQTVYTVKAFHCMSMAQLVLEENMGLEISTVGELEVAIRAGVDPAKLVLHGVYKGRHLMRRAIEQGVGRIVIYDNAEMDCLDELHAEKGSVATVLVRANPEINVPTHKSLATGCLGSQFGFSIASDDAHQALRRAASSDSMHLLGIHFHLGSQLFEFSVYGSALRKIHELATLFDIRQISVGGGLGVPHVAGDPSPTISKWATYMKNVAQQIGCEAELTAEPGRSIVGLAGITLYKVGTIKQTDQANYVIVSGGMTDNLRPALYGASYEACLPREIEAPRDQEINLVGHHCETGDILIDMGCLPSSVGKGDIVAIPSTGAYSYSMSSNYHLDMKPAVVFVANGEARLVVRRQTVEDYLVTDMMANDIV